MTTATDDSAVTAPAASRREWIGLAVLALPCMLYSMDLTVLNLAVPSLSADLAPTATLLWIVDIYGFLVAGADHHGHAGRPHRPPPAAAHRRRGLRCPRRCSPLLGQRRDADRHSRSPRPRGRDHRPSRCPLIRNMFHEPKQRTAAIGVWITSYSVGAAIGPLVGGVLLQHFWWGSVFLAGVPVMLLLLAVGPVLLPEYRDPAAGRLDLFSAGLSLVSVLAVIYGLKQMAEHGPGGYPRCPSWRDWRRAPRSCAGSGGWHTRSSTWRYSGSRPSAHP